MNTITCTLDHLAAICADLASKGITFEAKIDSDNYLYTITITGF